MPARIRYGTSSWTAKGWAGTFYPEGTKPADQLAYYATQFDTVEADNTYVRVRPIHLVRAKQDGQSRVDEHCRPIDRARE